MKTSGEARGRAGGSDPESHSCREFGLQVASSEKNHLIPGCGEGEGVGEMVL